MAKSTQAKKKKRDKINQIDGETVKKYTSLAEILGEEDGRVGNPQSFEDYKKKLREMNTADIQEHCVEMGLLPDYDRQKMIERLEKEWRKNFSKYRNVYQVEEPVLDKNDKASIIRILSRSK